MRAEPGQLLPRSWSVLDFGLHAFLVVNPLALGLWTFSFAPLVGGNLVLAVVLAGVVMVLGAIVYGALAARAPWTGGEYTWQTRFLDPRVGAVLTLTASWIVVAALASAYGNVLVVQTLDPLFVHAGWDGVASWLRGREGTFAASLVAIAVAAAFVGVGMRRARIVQRIVVLVGAAALLVFLGLLFTSSPGEFRTEFDSNAVEVYDAGPIAYGQTLYLGTNDARVSEVELGDTLRLVPLLLLFGLWIGWVTPLVGEVRARAPGAIGAALVRVAVVSTLLSLVLLIAFAVAFHWEFWNEANNLYWGTVYETTPTALLPAWPNPVVFAAWLTDSTAAQVSLIAAMGVWIVGAAATLFLSATRVLLAATQDRLLPERVGRLKGDAVPVNALALLVLPACGLAALDAYWDTFASWASAAIVALALMSAGSGIAAVRAFRRERPAVAVVSVVFTSVVVLVAAAWLSDPVFGFRSAGHVAFLLASLRGCGRHRGARIAARDCRRHAFLRRLGSSLRCDP